MFLKYDIFKYFLVIFERSYQLFFCFIIVGFSLSGFSNEGANDIQEKPFEKKMSFDKTQALEPTEISQLELRTSASDPILANTIENDIKAQKIIRLGQISGIITDSITGNPLHAVAVIIEGTDFGTITDIQGQYTLSDIPVGNYTLIFIKSGFIETKITGNQIVASGETQLDFAMPARPIEMSDEVYELQDFIVTAEEVASQNVELLMYRQLSIASLEALSSEDFAKFAASDAAEAISKISGASLNDGKYVVMRGLNDRYNTTLVNGVRLPSPDPDRKAVAMDIFPTSLFESIVARKTYTSNMPGESSGGSIELRTKSAPEEPFVKFSAGFGQQLTSPQTDQYLGDPEQLSYSNWLKGKDGDRGYSLVPGSKNFTSNYPTQVGGAGFPRMAPNVVAFPKWGDRSYSLSAGNSWLINDWLTVGAILGLKTGEKKRTSYKEFFKKEINDSKKTVKEIALKANGGGMTTSEEEYSLSTLAGLNFQIADHSSVNYTYLLAKTLSSKATVADYKKFGEVTLFEASTPDSEYHDARDIELLAQDRLLEAHQFSGEHKFKFLIPKEWDFSWYHTDAFMSQGEPDIRNVAEFYPAQDSFAADPGLEPLSRYQRFTEQESTMFGLGLEQEFKIGEKASIRFQLGYDSEDSAREFQQLEMLNQDERYVTDPYFGAMPFPDAFGITNISEPERFQTTVGGMNAIIEQLFTTNIANALSDLGASQTNLNNAQTSYTNAESDFLIKKTNFDTGFIGFVEPGTNYDNFTSSNTYNEAIVNQELARLEQGLDPTPGLGGFDMLNQDYAIAAYADGLLTPLQANLNTAQSDFDSADDNADLINNEYGNYQNSIEPLITAPAVNIVDVNYPGFSFFGDDAYVLNTPRGSSLYSDQTVQSVQFDQVGGYFQASGRNEVESFYALADIKFNEQLRVSCGLRNESTNLFYKLVENNDGEPRPSSNLGGSVNPYVERFDPIDQTDRLGYVSIIVEPVEQIKIQFSKSTTVAKPTFREIAPFPIFNLADRSFEIGNPGLVKRVNSEDSLYVLPDEFAGLEIADVESMDLKIEYYTPLDGVLSLGYFEKEVGAPIERVYAYTAGGVPVNTFINNNNDAELSGVEIEVQQNLGVFDSLLGPVGEMFTIGVNYTKIDAKVGRSIYEQKALSSDRVDLSDADTFQSGGSRVERSLYNQPEYIANAFISFDLEKTGTKITLSNSWTGQQLQRAGGLDNAKVGVPDLYWGEFAGLNLAIQQNIGENLKISFSAKYINNPTRKLYEDKALFDEMADQEVYADSSTIYNSSVNGIYQNWRSRQSIDPTFSLSISGSF
jgi:hypothetical protein